MIIDTHSLKAKLNEVDIARSDVARAQSVLDQRLVELSEIYNVINAEALTLLDEARSQLGWETSWENSHD